MTLLAFWQEFLVFAMAHIMSLISPGPDFLMVVQSSLRYCRKTALWVAFGISCGEIIHVSYSLLGIGWLITQSLFWFNVLKYLGSAYLLYIGIASIRVKKQSSNSVDLVTNMTVGNISPQDAFRRGFITNALNVKAAFFTISIFTVLVGPDTPIAVKIFYGAFIQISSVLWFSLVALFLTNPHIQSRFLGIKHWIERICGALMIILGLKLAL